MKPAPGRLLRFHPLHRGLTVIILNDVIRATALGGPRHGDGQAAFTILCPRYPDQPEEVLQRLNRLMLSILNRSKMMSCFLGILDVQASA